MCSAALSCPPRLERAVVAAAAAMLSPERWYGGTVVLVVLVVRVVRWYWWYGWYGGTGAPPTWWYGGTVVRPGWYWWYGGTFTTL